MTACGITGAICEGRLRLRHGWTRYDIASICMLQMTVAADPWRPWCKAPPEAPAVTLDHAIQTFEHLAANVRSEVTARGPTGRDCDKLEIDPCPRQTSARS